MRGLVLLAAAASVVAGCDRDIRHAGSHARWPMVPAWLPAYDAALPTWPPALATGSIGRGVPPSRAEPAGLAAIAGTWAARPIMVTAVHAIPAGDPASDGLAVVSGVVDDGLAVEAIAIDAGEVRWRDTTGCQAPVVHVTAAVVVCAGATGIAALDAATGVARWRRDELTYVGASADAVVATRGLDRVAVIDVATGATRAEAAVPVDVVPAELHTVCVHDDGFEIWAWSSVQLQRFLLTAGATGEVASMRLPRAPARVEPCEEPALVELPLPGRIERELYALRREPLGFADGALLERGFWRRDLGEVGVATARGIEVRDVTLGEVAILSDAQVGREIAARGTRRLVRGAAGLPVLLDGDVPVAYLSAPAHLIHAALGDAYLLGGSWQPPARSLADRVDRFLLPGPVARPVIPPVIPPPPPQPAMDVPDLPAVVDAPASIDLPGAGAYEVGAVALDPLDPTRVYVAVLEARPDATRGAGVAAFDLAARRWLWHAPDGCPAGLPVNLAPARDVILCGSRGSLPGSGRVRAIDRADGAVRWTWAGVTVDAVVAGGGLAAVIVGRRALVLDAATGVVVQKLRADDGFVPRFVLVEHGGLDVLIVAERGAVVARLPRVAMLPLWAVDVEGTVVGLGGAGGRVTAELSTGELYLLDPGDGAAVAVSGWARRWRLLGPGDAVAIEGVEGPAAAVAIEGVGAPAAAPMYRLDLFGSDGAPRFAVGLALEPPWQLGPRGAPGAPVVVAHGPASLFAAVLDARSGVVRRRVALPDRAAPGMVFSTAIDGAPVAGAVLRQPLGILLF